MLTKTTSVRVRYADTDKMASRTTANISNGENVTAGDDSHRLQSF